MPKGRRWNFSEMQTAWHSFRASGLPFIMAQSLCPGQEGPRVPTRPLHVALERSGPLDKTHPPRAHANLTDSPCDQGPAAGLLHVHALNEKTRERRSGRGTLSLRL